MTHIALTLLWFSQKSRSKYAQDKEQKTHKMWDDEWMSRGVWHTLRRATWFSWDTDGRCLSPQHSTLLMPDTFFPFSSHSPSHSFFSFLPEKSSSVTQVEKQLAVLLLIGWLWNCVEIGILSGQSVELVSMAGYSVCSCNTIRILRCFMNCMN